MLDQWWRLLLQNAMLEAKTVRLAGCWVFTVRIMLLFVNKSPHISFNLLEKRGQKNSLIKMGQNLLSEESIVEDIIETMVDNGDHRIFAIFKTRENIGGKRQRSYGSTSFER